MKLINYYHYGYLFDCIISGKIIVSRHEWGNIKKYLLRSKSDSLFSKNLLKEDLNRTIKTKEGELLNIRVTATEKAMNKFASASILKKFKGQRRNYMFLITNK